jgi:hypothetical protein
LSATLKQRLVSVVQTVSKEGCAPFAAWASRGGKTPEAVKAMKDADIGQVLISVYGGRDVVEALSKGGLDKLYINDLAKVLGHIRARKIAVDLLATPAPIPAPKPVPKMEQVVETVEAKSSAWSMIWRTLAVIGAAYFLWKFKEIVIFILILGSMVGGGVGLLLAQREDQTPGILTMAASAVVFVVAIIFAVIVGGHEAEVQEAADKTKRSAEKLEGDKKEAARMGLALAVYQRADDLAVGAHVDCASAVKSQAAWSASSDFLPKYSWSVSGNEIIIDGNDVKMKNGFGGERNVSYSCRYDMNTRETEVTSVD